jgi:hypothetical protein
MERKTRFQAFQELFPQLVTAFRQGPAPTLEALERFLELAAHGAPDVYACQNSIKREMYEQGLRYLRTHRTRSPQEGWRGLYTFLYNMERTTRDEVEWRYVRPREVAGYKSGPEYQRWQAAYHILHTIEQAAREAKRI